MTKQVINVGSAANDGSGTPARTAFQYINANFTEVYDFLTGTTNATTLPAALPIAKGGTGASSAADARTNLGLGNAAQGTLTTSTFDSILGRILKVGDFGLGSSPITQAGLTLDQLSGASHFGFGDRLFSGYGHGYIMIGGVRPAILGLYNGEFCYKTKKDAEAYSPTYTVKSTKNTTIDANGFLKSASPVVKLFKDHIELNSDAEKQPIEFKKVDVGDYLLKGSLGFAQEGWYIEVPKDANGNTIVAVVYDTLENGDLSIKTYKRKFDFELAAVVADLEIPTDIPEGRWIDIRLHEEIVLEETLPDDIEQ
ncbi:phage tail protein [Acinetobacter baumannii]|nr:phage tail protein [Acinetobacter baumannii]AVI32578.1 putative tail fiber [Acinetobacter baumannii]AVI37956.1 putative tail fiber [Acinetobacter baumannii]EHU1449950.1 phage tail protein [Acinetobacter baumannii]EHU1749020.1 phage tail protein [Acinetobacter baumannii]EHU1801092.1 phage tail protein [Acinetobacter baumannii]